MNKTPEGQRCLEVAQAFCQRRNVPPHLAGLIAGLIYAERATLRKELADLRGHLKHLHQTNPNPKDSE